MNPHIETDLAEVIRDVYDPWNDVPETIARHILKHYDVTEKEVLD